MLSDKKRASRARTRRIMGVAGTCLVLGLGCDSKRQAPSEDRARFGVFFGGQLQERKELPFELDPRKLRPGFRIEFAEPLKKTVKLQWELSKPGPLTRRNGLPSPSGRITQLGSVMLSPGAKRFDQSLLFAPGDPTGLWNLRVSLEDRVLIDRPFTVYDRASRRAAIEKARVKDAGF